MSEIDLSLLKFPLLSVNVSLPGTISNPSGKFKFKILDVYVSANVA